MKSGLSSLNDVCLSCWLDIQKWISVKILFDSVLQERPEFSEVVAKLEECLCNVEVGQVHITKRLTCSSTHIHSHSIFVLLCVSSWCPRPRATAVVLCLPLPPRTAWRHEEVPDGVTWPRSARVLSWNMPWMLEPMRFGARSTNSIRHKCIIVVGWKPSISKITAFRK